MRKFVITTGLIAMALSSFAQLTIKETKDEMTDKVYYDLSEGLLCISEDKTLGFRIDPSITAKNGIKEMKDLIITMAGLGKCNEKNTLIILYEGGEKTTLKSWNKFNCKATTYFALTPKNIEQLKTKTISKIRLTNGQSYKSYTDEIKYKSYFVELFNLLN